VMHAAVEARQHVAAAHGARRWVLAGHHLPDEAGRQLMPLSVGHFGASGLQSDGIADSAVTRSPSLTT
jgi:hypothetical protein